MPKTDTWTTLTIGVELELMTCVHGGCGIQWAAPSGWVSARRNDHQSMFCPNGHSQSFTAKTDAEKFREQLADSERKLKWQTDRSKRLANDNMTLAKSRSALRGVVTRLKNKAAAGICQWCDHEFPDVAAHVAEAHPGVVTEATDEDEEAD